MKDAIEKQLKGGAHGAGSAAELMDLMRDEPDAPARLAACLADPDPQVRGGAAEALAVLAERNTTAVLPIAPALIEAMDQEETRTRIGACRALAAIAAANPDAVEEEIDALRLGVFDPAHPDMRRHTALLLGRFGAGHPERGRRVFPHLAEAVRRFHDRPGAPDLMEGIAALCAAPVTPDLGREIWKAVRSHERHADARVRDAVTRISARVRGAPS